jgi:hypothetical protein
MAYPTVGDLPAEPQFTAGELLAEIERREGRIFRMPELCVFVLTTNEETAAWLLDLGGKSYIPPGLPTGGKHTRGAYIRDPRSGLTEWDIYVHAIPVRGEQTVWQAAREVQRQVAAEQTGAAV